MRRARIAFFTFVACLGAAGTARAGINFATSESISVAPRPEYMATGDLNGDNRADIVVVSPSSREIDVYLGADSPSQFAPARTYTLGQNLNNLTLADLNRDNRLDIVVTDQSADLIYYLLGVGDGQFGKPNSVGFGRHPVAVAVADFDGINGPDLAVVDDRLGQLFILANDGENPPSFRVVLAPAVGEEPTDVRVVDFNHDGRPDIMTLNTGGPRVKEVAVLLLERVVNAGTAAAIPDFSDPQKFTVGERPSSVVIADFNNDGNPDVAMLNKPSGSGNSEIQLLLGRGDGVLLPPRVQPVPCPFFTGGAPCRSIAMAAADYDGNGTVDVAVALADPRRSRGSASSLADALFVYSGRGDGVLVPGPLFSIPKAPLSMAASDVTGDGKPEISIANQRTLKLSCFVNVSTPAEKQNGDPCLLGDECISARCTNGVCCAGQCDTTQNEVCNVPGREGICTPLIPAPVECMFPEDCDTGFCVDGFCCDDACDGGRCDAPGYIGLCIPGLPDGEPCNGDDRECSSGFCTDNFVCCRERCDGGFCDDIGVCHTLLGPGDQCNLDPECQSNVCDAFDGICCNRRCDEVAEFCNADGRCTLFTDPTTTPMVQNTPTPTATRRATPGPNGVLCAVGADCVTGNCVDGVCCESDSCAEDQHCEEGSGMCVAGTPAGPNTPTPTSTAQPTVTGGVANCGGQCAPQNCINNICVVSSTSSGCSAGGGATDGGNLLVVTLLPLALWLGRRWQLHRAVARARAPRR